MRPLRSICLITNGLQSRQIRLQPWRYLSEVAIGLAAAGHRMTVITDAVESASLPHVEVVTVPTVRQMLHRPNDALRQAIAHAQPDVVLWHIGLTSLLHQQLETGINGPVIGIFTSPLYPLDHFGRIGWGKTLSGYKLSGTHVAGSIVPQPLLRQSAKRHLHLRSLVVQTESTRQALKSRDVWKSCVDVIPPGVDEHWQYGRLAQTASMRRQLGYQDDDFVLLYFGSPAPLRGLHRLLQAVAQVVPQQPRLKLLVLSRRHADELMEEDKTLREMLTKRPLCDAVKLVSGFLPPSELVTHVAAADVVALPFELVPSDAPLSLLEAKALGKPVITTDLGCLPELVQDGVHYLATPGDVISLASAINTAILETKTEQPQMKSPVAVTTWAEVGETWSKYIQTIC